MKKNFTYCILLSVIMVLFSHYSQAQHFAWYNSAQQRIDTLRKGNFGFQILDQQGEPFLGNVSVRMAKHEFPFGIAFDFYEGAMSMGNTYTTQSPIEADEDFEIYQSERWNRFLAYALPAEEGKEYILTLKFAEIYFSSSNSRLIDVYVDGELFLKDFDVHKEAGGRNIAIDTSMTVTAVEDAIRIEITATLDNSAIKGIVLEEIDEDNVLRINCGGNALTTADGNEYVSEAGFFDAEANTVASKEQWMKAAMYKYYNAGVSGNSFKWSGIQPQHTTPNYTNFDNAVQWTQKVGWDLRAHTLLWGGNDDHSMPRWVRNLPTPQAIIDTCKMRVIREVTRYRGIIKDYDVINEPLTNHADWLRNHVGDSIIWNSFKWARSADPDAELYVNDYNVEYNWGQAAEYRDLILKMLENDAPVTGVGMQAHFWDCCRPNINELVSNINIVAEAGLPIKLTEYDFGGNLTQAQQVSDYIMVLTIAFSHPSIVGMYHWGLSDEGAWRENTGFFDRNLKPKLAADTLLYFTQKKWATNFDSIISQEDGIEFKAYYGTYEIEVEFDDAIKVFTVPFLNANADSIFVLHENDAVLKGPQLLYTELIDGNKVKLIFDKPIKENSLRRSDFKFFSSPSIGLQAVEIDPENPHVVIFSLASNVPKGRYISVSYFPGRLESVDGSKAKAFGPDAVDNPADIDVQTPTVAKIDFNVYPNPATNYVNIIAESTLFNVSIFNSLGMQVYSERATNPHLKVDISNFKNGLYLIKLTDANNQTQVLKFIKN